MTPTEAEAKYLQPTYTRQPITLTRGSGTRVWDADGREYLDCLAGIAVNVCGHCHPKIVEAIQKQAETLIHTSNLYYTEPQIKLAEELSHITGLDRIFFCNSGTEAAEAAMKLARRATGKTDFIAAENSFHGRTLGALSLTHTEKYRAPFEPLIPGVTFVKYDDAAAIAEAITPDTAAVVLEAVQGEGGIKIASKEYLKEVREICDERDVLLILDEVQTGFGRTGAWFACEHYGITPDIMTMAKALGSGVPIGAMASREDEHSARISSKGCNRLNRLPETGCERCAAWGSWSGWISSQGAANWWIWQESAACSSTAPLIPCSGSCRRL
jgi:acetylornithine/N-succinyldiaminopimelate aminotransferase